MKRPLRLLLALTGLLLLAALAAFLAAWHYMELPETIEKIRAAASAAAGGDVQFADLDLMPLRGASVDRVRIYAETPGRVGEEFLTMGRLRLDYRPWRLLMRTIDFKRIRIDAPRLVVRQNSDGSWRHPRFHASTFTDQLTFQTGLLRFSILLDQFELKDGSMEFVADDGRAVYQARGIALSGGLAFVPGSGTARGRILVQEMAWGGLLAAERMNSPIVLQDEVLLLPEITADMHGGRVEGSARIDLGLGGPRYESDLRLRQVSLATLLQDLKARSGLVSGLLDACAQFSGTLQDPTLVRATGELEIKDARVFLLSGIAPLDQLIDLPELRAHTFPALKGTFKIADEVITFYNLEAASETVQITAAGRAGLDRSIDFDISLALHGDLAAKLPEKNRARLTPRPDGFLVITFKMDGTMDEPRSNLLDKLGLAPVLAR